jgi:hypothetical protein
MRQRSSSNSSRDVKLPHWMFDVDSDDEYDENNIGLLEELDIDFVHIFRNIGNNSIYIKILLFIYNTKIIN